MNSEIYIYIGTYNYNTAEYDNNYNIYVYIK